MNIICHVPETRRVTAATVVDHIIRIVLKALESSDKECRKPKPYFGIKELQSLCEPHHSTKQRIEKSVGVTGCNGWHSSIEPSLE